jgi:hypothetical protein
MRWVLFFACVAAFAAEPLPLEAERRAGLARSLPAPFSGSALLQVARMKGLSAEQRADLAGEAYRIATAAKLKDFGSFAGGDDSSLGALQTLSWMEELNPLVNAVEAYQIDRSLPFPGRGEVPAVGCEAVMVEDPHGYYAAALQAGEEEFRQAFGASHKAIEVARASAVLRKANDALREELLPALDAKLARLADSDREFHYAVTQAKLGDTAIALGLVGTYRETFLRHWKQKRCADLPEASWNKAIQQLKLKEMPPREVGPGPKDEELFTDAEGRRLAAEVEDLGGEEALLTGFLRRVEEWQPKPKDPVAETVGKGLLYFMAWMRLREGAFGDRPVRLLGKQLGYGTLKKDAPVAWMLGASVLKDWAKDNPARIAEVKSMGDPALAAYLEFHLN